MADAAAHATLTVLGGPLDGRQLVLDQAVDEVLIGSDPDCGLFLDLPTVSPIHARVWMDQEGVQVHDTHSPQGVYVNDDPVSGKCTLRDGDILWLGAPGGDGSVMLQWRAARAGADSLVPAAQAPEMAPGDLAVNEPEPTAADAAAFPETYDDEESPFVVTEQTTEAAGAWTAPAPSADMAEPEPMPEEPIAAAGFDDLVTDDVEPEPAVVEPAHNAVDETFYVDDAAPAAEAAPEPEVPAVDFVAPAVEAPAEPEPVAAAEAEVPAFDFAAATAEAAAEPAPEPEIPAFDFAAPAAEPVAQEAAPFDFGAPAAPPAPAPPLFEPPSALFDAGHAVEEPPPPAPRATMPAPVAMDMEEEEPAPAGARSAPGAGRAPVASRPAAPVGRGGARASGGGNTARNAGIAAAALVVLGLAGFFGMRAMKAPSLTGVTPARAARGATLTLSGQNFAAAADGNTVTIGSTPARVVSASETSLQVEVPELPTQPGTDVSLPVIVSVDGKLTEGIPVAVFQAPRIQSVVPSVAMPGEQVVLTGTGFSPTAKVKFGATEAAPAAATATSLTVVVPPLTGAPGTDVPITVVSGADTSAASSLMLGRLPLLSGVTPAGAMPGDVITISGRGFATRAADNDVRIGGVKALVGSATDAQLQVLVPRMEAAATAAVVVKVPGSENTGEGAVAITALPDPIEFRFVAEPFVDAEGHDHAVLVTGVGPALVLSAAGGRSAGERAFEAVQKLNGVRATIGAVDMEPRGLDAGDPVVGIAGKPDFLVRVTNEDAAAYGEDWTKLGGKGGAATPARLAVWWTAVARDLGLMLGRGQRPQHAAALAPEGKALGDVFDAAAKANATGIPRGVIAGLKPGVREGLRLVGYRLPASVTGPAAPAPATPPPVVGGEPLPPAAPAGPALKLEGAWAGNETVDGVPSAMTLTFDGAGGTVTLRRAVSLTIKLQAVQKQKAGVRFRLDMGGKSRHYSGSWDGEKIKGTIATDSAGKSTIGSFQLTPVQ